MNLTNITSQRQTHAKRDVPHISIASIKHINHQVKHLPITNKSLTFSYKPAYNLHLYSTTLFMFNYPILSILRIIL